jgi:hypothetical protein
MAIFSKNPQHQSGNKAAGKEEVFKTCLYGRR